MYRKTSGLTPYWLANLSINSLICWEVNFGCGTGVGVGFGFGFGVGVAVSVGVGEGVLVGVAMAVSEVESVVTARILS